MSESKISICNKALSHIGQGKIASLDDGSEKARQLDLNYDNSLETTLRAFNWNFANKISTLALTDDTTPGWEYVYQYPPDCAKVINVFDEGNARVQEKQEFKIFTNGNEKFIATDVEDAYVEYTANIIDPNIYDALFVKALSYMLAAEISNALSGNSQKQQEMLQKYSMAVSEAQLATATEKNVPIEWPTSYIKGRR